VPCAERGTVASSGVPPGWSRIVDLRVAGEDRASVRRVAGLFSQLRSENEFARREMRVRRILYGGRIANAAPNPLPGLRAGVLSTSELATLWQLPRGRVKHGGLLRSSVRRASAPAGIAREPVRPLLRDERGPVSIAARRRLNSTQARPPRL
jgi:hypothetical protein